MRDDLLIQYDFSLLSGYMPASEKQYFLVSLVAKLGYCIAWLRGSKIKYTTQTTFEANKCWFRLAV